MPALLQTRGLWAGYGTSAVVRDLSLEVHPGEVVALLGPNGAGKSTTIMTLAGELNALRGEVLLLGEVTRRPCTSDHAPGSVSYPKSAAS